MDNKPSHKAVEARDCMEKAVRDELVKKARLGQDVIINRDGEPYKISAAEALRVQEESTAYRAPNHESKKTPDQES